MRYVPEDTQVTFREIPDEISLCVNFSCCCIRCPDCHSKYLWNNVGDVFTFDVMKDLVQKNQGITCFCFMGASTIRDIRTLTNLLIQKLNDPVFKDLKFAWYTGLELNEIPKDINPIPFLNYIKVGPYKAECGPLDNPNTNQKLYRIDKTAYGNILMDITEKLYKPCTKQ